MAFQDKFDIAEAINKAIKLRNDGLTPIPIIKAIREEFGMGLRDAKLIYHYSLPPTEQEAQEKFWDELVDALEKLTEESSHEG
jgi:ribosomal protein L7/L12